MTCLEQYLVSIYMTSVLVSDLSNPVVKNSRLECLTACFRKATCSTCFFDQQTQTCSSNGYRFVRKGSLCLKVSSERLNWKRARDACEYEGARLVKIDTEEKNVAIVEILKKDYQGQALQIGAFRDQEGDDTWRWPDNSALVFSNWDTTSAGRRECSNLDMDMHKWIEISCGVTQRYICEQGLSVVNS
ncbi:macrophage mannose receptor 1-like [Gigantopelta aegis]|uniref:macrophage mannose receptor 1-like n=1 Tax=Gigantopelta aegis TaxID=1735272 RepID=UPI001B8876FB|nr:macrophage mannose receptor 1-like [Gigantopelta aegis]